MSPTDPLPLPLARRVDALCCQFEAAWKALAADGTQPRIEVYLAEVPAQARAVLLRELLRVEVHYRRQAGEELQAADYQSRFPDLDLKELAAVLAPAPELQRDGSTAVPPGDGVCGAARSAGATQVGHSPPSAKTEGIEDAPAVPGYDMLEVLGRGGMGVVYKAHDRQLNRVVALKMILAGGHAGPHELLRFRREAEAVAQLHHPHIVQIHEVGEHAGWPYLVLEFMDGGNLDQHLGGTPQPPRAAAELVETLARAVQHAHAHGVVHRDLKPANVLLSSGRDRPGSAAATLTEGVQLHELALAGGARRLDACVPKIADFGLAKLLGDSAAGPTRSGDVLGTPSYMAPEQTMGEPGTTGPATDVYGLGAILYELLTGRPPFQAETALETLLLVRSAEPVSPSQLQPKCPRDLVTICLKCLQKAPRARYASAQALADDLRRFLEDRPIKARPVGALERTVKWVRRRPALAALLAVIVVVTVAGLPGVTWLWWRAEQGWSHADLEHQKAEFRLYLNHVALAQHELLNNNVGQANQLLKKCPERFRQWEWWYLHRRCHTALFTLTGQAIQVGDVAFSPDGRWIAAVRRDHTLTVWDAATQEARYSITLDPGNDPQWLLAVAFSSDGRYLAVAGQDAHVRICDAATGGNLRAFAGHKRIVNHVAFSPDGKRLMSSSDDGSLRVWDVTTGQAVHALPTGHGRALGVAWSPVGTVGASVGDDGTVRLWDLATCKELRTLRGHRTGVLAVRFSPDGRFLASGDWGGLVKIWNTATGEEIHSVAGHTAGVWSVAFSPDGRYLASAGFDGGLKIWKTSSGAEWLRLSSQSGPVNGVAFSPDGRLLAAGGDDNLVRVWDVTRAHEVVELGKFGWLFSVAFSPADRHIVAIGRNNPNVTVWDTRKDTPRHLSGGFLGDITTVVFSADGQRLAAASDQRQARVWDLRTGQEIAPPGGKFAGVVALAFGPENQLLGVVAKPGSVTVRDLLAGRDLFRVSEDKPSLQGAAFSRDGLALATADTTGMVKVWETQTGRDLLQLPAKAAAAPDTGLAFSRDRRQLAVVTTDPVVTTNHVVSLWDLTTAQRTALCQGHHGRIKGLAFSADGRRLATAGHTDMTVKLWDTSTGLEALTIRGHKDHLEGVAFSADGQRLASVGWEGFVKVWDAIPREPKTPAERLRQSDQEAPAWHTREAEENEKARAWLGAIVHLDALIRAHPDQGAFYARRGQAHFELEHCAAAAADYDRALAAGVQDGRIGLNQAYLRLRQGDREGYRAVCARLLAALGPTANALTANNTAWRGCLLPDAVVNPARIVQLAEQGVAAEPRNPIHLNTLGAALYRAKRWQEAVQKLEEAIKVQGQGGVVEDWLFLSMAHHQLGHADQARDYLARATGALDQEELNPSMPWYRRLECQVLRQEAETLLRRPNP
jgi:WD40 repeat protein/serine/threonine protein kinase